MVDDREDVVITRAGHEPFVIVSLADFESLREATYLMRLVWDRNAWQDYLWWQTENRQILKRINLLSKEITRNGDEGIGKPERFKHDFAGYWLRRMTDERRLVNKIAENDVRIAPCRYHYGH